MPRTKVISRKQQSTPQKRRRHNRTRFAIGIILLLWVMHNNGRREGCGSSKVLLAKPDCYHDFFHGEKQREGWTRLSFPSEAEQKGIQYSTVYGYEENYL